MPAYHPAWRRPIANVFRATAGGAVRWCVAHSIHPNTVSYSSIAAAAAAGIAESTISAVLAGKRKLNRTQVAGLVQYFHVEPVVFLSEA